MYQDDYVYDYSSYNNDGELLYDEQGQEGDPPVQGCISCETCSYPELTEDHVLTSAYVKIFRIVTRNAVNKSF